MNKILVFSLLVCTLVALTAGSEENGGELELRGMSLISREVRDADPKKGRKGKGRKNASKNGKRNGKGKRKNRKNHTKVQKKSKKNGKKERKNENKKGNSNKKKSVGRQSAVCNDSACLTNIVKYMTQLKDKVKNFENQKKRIEQFTTLAKKKGDKKDVFTPVLFRVTSTGGGDASALTCGGEKDSEGATEIKTLADGLTKCSENIDAKCMTAKPEMDDAAIEDCATKMEAFKAAAKKCTDIEEDAQKCECWNADDIKMASDAISTCDISALSKNMATFKKDCVSAFAECRKLEDSANDVIFKCNPENNKGALLSNLKGATENAAALNNLKDAANSLTTSGRRMKRQTVTCTAFASGIEAILALLAASASDSDAASKSEALIAAKPASCTEEEITAIQAVTVKIDATIVVVQAVIVTIQTKLEAVTGTTASAEVIENGTTPAAEDGSEDGSDDEEEGGEEEGSMEESEEEEGSMEESEEEEGSMEEEEEEGSMEESEEEGSEDDEDEEEEGEESEEESTEDTTMGSTEDTTMGSTEDTTMGSTEDTTMGSTEDTTMGSTEDTTMGSTEDTTAGSTEDTTAEETTAEETTAAETTAAETTAAETTAAETTAAETTAAETTAAETTAAETTAEETTAAETTAAETTAAETTAAETTAAETTAAETTAAETTAAATTAAETTAAATTAAETTAAATTAAETTAAATTAA